MLTTHGMLVQRLPRTFELTSGGER
jgi:hypothetical protein